MASGDNKAFTWHHQSPWVKETAEMARKAFEWPMKQLKKVQADMDRVAGRPNGSAWREVRHPDPWAPERLSLRPS